MPFSLEKLDLEHKPYNKCIVCKYLGVLCDGPNFLAMTSERRGEWARLRRIYLGWTLEDVAERAKTSTVTIYRLENNIGDPKVSTLEAIFKTLVNGSWGQYPCAIDAIQTEDDTLTAKCQAAQAQLEDAQRKVDHLLKQTEFDKEQLIEKDRQIASKDERLAERRDFLYRKDRVIWILSALLGVAVLIILAGFVIDAMNPDRGFFWLSQAFKTGHNFIGML